MIVSSQDWWDSVSAIIFASLLGCMCKWKFRAQGRALVGGCLLEADDGLVNETLAEDETLVCPEETLFDDGSALTDCGT